MRLARFEIRNFKNLEYVSLEWDDILYLIGENNAGKSSVLVALDVFLSGKQVKNPALFRNGLCEESSAMELTGHFTDLTEAERNKPAVLGRMHGDQWILKKQFWCDNDGESADWHEQYYSFQPEETIENWPAEPTTWTSGWPDDFKELIEEVIAEVGNKRCTEAAREILKGKIRSTRADLIILKEGWVKNPGGGGSWKSNANSVLPLFVYIPAVQDATEETKAKEETTYGRIISLILERKLATRPEVIQLNEQLKRVQALFKRDTEHPEWEQAEEIQRLESEISDRLSAVISAKATVEPTEVDLKSYILPGTLLKIDDGYKTDVPHQGNGLQRSLIITLLQILNQYAREAEDADGLEQRCVIFGIEEPEIYMHPHMLRRVREVLTSLASQQKYQVISTTHSPILIDIADNQRNIAIFKKDATRNITVLQVKTNVFDGTNPTDDRDRFRMILEFDPAVNELFFAKRVVLVEGDTECAIFPKAADLLNLFPTDPSQKRDTTLIQCHGKTSIPLFCMVLNHFGIPYTVVHDIDAPADPQNGKISSLIQKGSTLVTFNPDIETELGITAAKNKALSTLTQFVTLAQKNSVPAGFVTKVRAVYGI